MQAIVAANNTQQLIYLGNLIGASSEFVCAGLSDVVEQLKPLLLDINAGVNTGPHNMLSNAVMKDMWFKLVKSTEVPTDQFVWFLEKYAMEAMPGFDFAAFFTPTQKEHIATAVDRDRDGKVGSVGPVLQLLFLLS